MSAENSDLDLEKFIQSFAERFSLNETQVESGGITSNGFAGTGFIVPNLIVHFKQKEQSDDNLVQEEHAHNFMRLFEEIAKVYNQAIACSESDAKFVNSAITAVHESSLYINLYGLKTILRNCPDVGEYLLEAVKDYSIYSNKNPDINNSEIDSHSEIIGKAITNRFPVTNILPSEPQVVALANNKCVFSSPVTSRTKGTVFKSPVEIRLRQKNPELQSPIR